MGCRMCSAPSQETHAFLNNDTKIVANTTGKPVNQNDTWFIEEEALKHHKVVNLWGIKGIQVKRYKKKLWLKCESPVLLWIHSFHLMNSSSTLFSSLKARGLSVSLELVWALLVVWWIMTWSVHYLGNTLSQVIMLGQEREELCRGPVVSHQNWI